MPCKETDCKCEATKTELIADGRDKYGICRNPTCGHPVLNHTDASAAGYALPLFACHLSEQTKVTYPTEYKHVQEVLSAVELQPWPLFDNVEAFVAKWKPHLAKSEVEEISAEEAQSASIAKSLDKFSVAFASDMSNVRFQYLGTRSTDYNPTDEGHKVQGDVHGCYFGKPVINLESRAQWNAEATEPLLSAVQRFQAKSAFPGEFAESKTPSSIFSSFPSVVFTSPSCSQSSSFNAVSCSFSSSSSAPSPFLFSSSFSSARTPAVFPLAVASLQVLHSRPMTNTEKLDVKPSFGESLAKRQSQMKSDLAAACCLVKTLDGMRKAQCNFGIFTTRNQWYFIFRDKSVIHVSRPLVSSEALSVIPSLIKLAVEDLPPPPHLQPLCFEALSLAMLSRVQLYLSLISDSNLLAESDWSRTAQITIENVLLVVKHVWGDRRLLKEIQNEVRVYDVLKGKGLCGTVIPFKIFEAFFGNQCILVTSYEGESLSRLHVTQRAPFKSEGMESLRELHRAGFGHCDLRSANVVISQNKVKLIDFGRSAPIDQLEQAFELHAFEKLFDGADESIYDDD